ncbi:MULTISPECIES: carbohydrate ABC transporter permease [Paenibacillus]|uniref:carbohydrate ABC transporter permease n=1 Tax=Paenibacillus TaxID=44249 RepID=UPI0016437990|nr:MULTISPECIES: carbohydrate ABC transporter permease [Paenibacillus]MBJ9992309.1 carbohydrate ABC transporter permease [Paenibacillus sp. S28]
MGKRRFNLFAAINGAFLILLALLTFYPLWHEISLSLSSSEQASRGGLFLWPRNLTFGAYGIVLRSEQLWLAYRNSIVITGAGTILSVFFTATTAYPLVKSHLPGRRLFTGLILFTMLFSGGIIPHYLLVKQLGMINTLWSMIIPGMISAFNVIIMLNFFRSLPEEIEESATMDGANPIRILFTIIFPLSAPVLATVALWEAVGKWNNFFQAFLYLNDKSLYTLPVLIREIIDGQQAESLTGKLVETSQESVIGTTIIVSVIPILLVYPFLQKYFTKGVLLGSVKS